MFHCPFHLPFYHSRCDTALSCCALTACAMWSRGSWGDPWFPHGAFVASLTFWYGLVILMFFPLFLLMSRLYNVITLALISPWTGTCHASVWLFCFGLLCFALFWWVCFWLFVFGLWWLRDGLLDYAQVLPVHSGGPSICRRPCMR